MELRHLRYFVAVAEEGSLTNAAERRLHTAQPSLSRQIRDLELEVGVKLLERKARGIALTAGGRAFLDHARLAKVWRHAKLNYCLISLRQNLKASPRSHGGDGGTWSIQRRTPPGSSMLNKHKWTSIHMCGRRIGARRLLL